MAVVGCGRVSTRYREVFRDELVDVAVVMAADLDPAGQPSRAISNVPPATALTM